MFFDFMKQNKNTCIMKKCIIFFIFMRHFLIKVNFHIAQITSRNFIAHFFRQILRNFIYIYSTKKIIFLHHNHTRFTHERIVI